MRRDSLVSMLLILSLCAVGSGCRPPAEDALDEIRALQAEGRFPESLDPLYALLDADPDRAEVHYLLGRALLGSGQSSSAIWPLRRAAESPAYAVEAGLLLARALLQGRNPGDAVAALDRVLEIAPENLVARELRVDALSAGARHAEALREIERVLELDPANPGVLAPRVTALIALERIDEAEQALEAARRQLESGESDAPEALRARLCITSGLFLFEKGDPQSAESRYAQCLEQFPTQPLAVYEGAVFYDRIGQSERATQIVRSAYTAAPADFREMLVRRMRALDRQDEVERLLVEATQERPSADTWFALADHYVDAENYAEALRAFERALALGSDPDPMLRFAYADTLIQAGRTERAQEVAGALDSPMLRDLIAGRAQLAQGDAAGALAALEDGLRLWPDNATARSLAGQAAEQLGDFERAAVHYRGALRAGRGSTEAGALLAELYAAQDNQRLALDVARRYVASRPDDPEAYRSALRVAERLGRYDACRELLAQLARLPGQAPVALAEEIALESALRGAEAAVSLAEGAPLDLADPANAPALRALLEELARLGAHERARARLDAALAAHPRQAVFHELRGRALQAEGAPVEAQRAAFERAAELDPQRAPALTALANLAAQASDVDRALALYARAARAAPEDPAAAYAASRLLLAQGRSGEAEGRLGALLQRHPRHAAAAAELSGLLLREGRDLERARALAQRAALFGSDPEALALLGRIQRALGEREAAAASFRRALEPERGLPESRRAALQEQLADLDAAQAPPAP